LLFLIQKVLTLLPLGVKRGKKKKGRGYSFRENKFASQSEKKVHSILFLSKERRKRGGFIF